MTEFIMVRHGEPDYSLVENWARIAVAKNFAPLTEKGIGQIHEIIEVLRGGEGTDYFILSFHKVYARCLYDVKGIRAGSKSGACLV